MVALPHLLIADTNQGQSTKVSLSSIYFRKLTAINDEYQSIFQHLYFIIAVAIALLLVSIRFEILR